ncbi:MAG: prolyl oligopeptidase family serine peptidase [Sphingomonadales bacterium]
MQIIRFFLLLPLLISATVQAQKIPLHHQVYDSWQRIGERMLSADGNWAVFTIDAQEGDGTLVLQSLRSDYRKEFPRGYGAAISYNDRFLVFKIKPYYAAVKEARNKKKKPEEMPKDSVGMLELGKDSVIKFANVRSFKMPSEEEGWVALHFESTEKSAEGGESPADLLLMQTGTGNRLTLTRISEFQLSKKGGKLVAEQAKNSKDSLSKPLLLLVSANDFKVDTILRGGNDFRKFAFSSNGAQLAFVAERDARPKELVKYYRLYYYASRTDTAEAIADRHTMGMPLGMTISEFAEPRFSDAGNRLFFGIAPIATAKDTITPEAEQVKVDIWHYNDDYLQTQQLFDLKRNQERSYTTVFHLDRNKLVPLGSPAMETIYLPKDADGPWVYATSDVGKRIEYQWTASTKKDIYRIDIQTGQRQLIRADLNGNFFAASVSPKGTALVWYDADLRQYQSWDGATVRTISRSIPHLLYDELHDMPGPAFPYGLAGWLPGDTSVLIYDRYDTWRVSIKANTAPKNITRMGRVQKENYRYVPLDPDLDYFPLQGEQCWRYQQQDNRDAGIAITEWEGDQLRFSKRQAGSFAYGMPIKALRSATLAYTKERFERAPDLHVWEIGATPLASERRISSINPQQAQYNWGTASLYRWRSLDGKPAQGILYRPENFDSTNKYPVIFYFYETHSETLHNYIAPSPTGSRLNISFYVSRGYIVVSPDIIYTTGYPAKSCYNYVVSAANSLAKLPYIDAKNMGIQGQSWGGIQVAQLVTMTTMFKAAWAGAPVANMTSAYGGIRWESGMNRQFQYEVSQSRIGATLWQRRDLYIENSPLFHLPKVKTPLVIMANDADGAVPWYQGIELFTGMRRLGKQVWMLNYNGEAHNLRERKNQKDISIRQQQFFDWLLKGEKPARWLTEGVPALNKGKDWGLDTEATKE